MPTETYLKTIRYRIIGGVGGKTRTEGTLADLFVQIPYAALSGLIPPFEVAKDLFGLGLVDAGMSGGCEWAPFSLSRRDYEAFAEDLLTRPEGAAGFPPAFARDESTTSGYDSWERWHLARAGSRRRRG